MAAALVVFDLVPFTIMVLVGVYIVGSIQKNILDQSTLRRGAMDDAIPQTIMGLAIVRPDQSHRVTGGLDCRVEIPH